MEFLITSYTGVNNILFGDTREAVRAKLNSRFESFKKGGDVDAFNDIDTHVHYDTELQVEAIEFFGKATPKFQNISLLETPYDKLLKQLSGLDDQIDEDESGFTSYKLGIGGFNESKDEEPGSRCEGIIAFRKDYYSL